ncbi:MAG: GNAT family N-acetyltransferase [Bdellovibrionota bacterium]
MELRSPGYKSEQIFTQFDGSIEDRGNYMVVRTPTNPTYFWGNLLIFDRPPRPGDFDTWTALFKKEFTDPRIYHVTIGWDSDTGEVGAVDEFVANGYELENMAAMIAKSVKKPPRYNEDLEMRILKSDEDWNEMIQVHTAASSDRLPRVAWENFYRKQSERYRKFEAVGMGHWYGGFLNGILVAGLGIYHRDGTGRYQNVSTHPDYQRRGVCGTLVYKSAMHAFQESNLEKLVMCADSGYHALRIYESVGFEQQVIEHGVCWWDRNRTE